MNDPILLKTTLYFIGAGLGILGFVAGSKILGIASRPRDLAVAQSNAASDAEGQRQRTLWAMFLIGVIGGVYVIIIAAR
jgi:hypothetical protein